MRNYLHIGLGKAASTTLQAAVFDRVPGLDFVGKRGVQPTPRNKALGAITQMNSFQYDEPRVLSDLALDHTRPILISDEMCSTYSRIDPYIIACRMRAILGDAKVLLITREPEDWLNSLYFFRLERGHPDVFQDHNAWLRSNLRARQVGSPLLQVFYARIFQTYEQVFGAGSVTLLPFEFLKREPQRFYRCVAEFLDLPADTIDAAGLKGKVFKKRFTADHFRMIRLLFDVEANRERIDRMVMRHFRGQAEAMQYRSGPIDEYRKMMAQSILALRLDGEESARVAFDEPSIRQIYAVNDAVDREIEQHHGIRLGDYGYRDLAGQPATAAPRRAAAPDQQTSVRELYDALAPKYDQVVSSSKYVGPDWLEQQLAGLAYPPKTVVDFACGTGHLGRLIRTHYPDAHLSGLDISDQMVAQAVATGVYDAVRVHDLHDPCPWIAGGSVDLAIVLGFFEFLADPSSFLAELARVLAPNGVMLLSFQEHRPGALGGRRSSGDLPATYTRDEVVAMLQALPLDLRDIRSVVAYVTGDGREWHYLMANAVRLPD